MRNALLFAVVLAATHFACDGDEGDDTDTPASGVKAGLTGGTTSTGSGDAAGMRTAASGGNVAVAEETGGDGATAGRGGETADTLCPNGIAEESLIIDSAAKLATASGCTTVKGDVSVAGEGIDNIDDLGDLTTIEGSLIIQKTAVSTLQPLGKLTFIGMDLYLSGLDITNLEGLGALTAVGGDVTISEDDSLVDLHGLDNLTSMRADQILNLKKNPSLPTCEAEWLVENLGRTMDGSDASVQVCSTVADECGSTAACTLSC